MSIAVHTTEIPWYREITGRQWRAFWAAYLGWALDAMDSMLYSVCILAIMKEFNLNTAQGGLLAAITFLAAGFGSWIYGILADKIGRRNSLMISILMYSLATGACGFAQTVTQLAIFRVIVGFGVGGEWGTGAALVSETWPTKYRAKVLGFVQSGFAVGYMLGALIAAFVLPAWGWRYVFFIGVLPALITLWIRSGVEETDHFAEMKKDLKAGKARKQGFIEKFGELWTGRYIKSTIGIMLYGAFSLFAWYAIFSWLPGYLGMPVEKGGAGLSVFKSNMWVIDHSGWRPSWLCRIRFFCRFYGQEKGDHFLLAGFRSHGSRFRLHKGTHLVAGSWSTPRVLRLWLHRRLWDNCG